MKCRISFSAFFFIVFMMYSSDVLSQETIELDGKPDSMVFHLDSIGNIINYKKHLELIKTGEYISIPFMNAFMEIEHLVRKRDPNNPLDSQYQVYAGRNMVISSKNAPMFSPKLSMGDAITAVCAQNTHSNEICIGEEKDHPNSILVSVNEKSWTQVRKDIIPFIENNTNIDFILVPPNKEKSLKYFFTNRFLKKTRNVYLAVDIQDELLSKNEPFPVYYMTDQAGVILLLVPPLANQKMALLAIQKFIDSQN